MLTETVLRILTILLGLSAYSVAKSLETVVAWKSMKFGFSSGKLLQHATESGLVIANKGNPIDVDVIYNASGKRRIFMTIPRLTDGIPFSLATVTPELDLFETFIEPYPSYDWHSSDGASCDGITSAHRIAIDQCNRLWVLDTGVIGQNHLCRPQLLVFDLNTDGLIHRYKIDQSLYNVFKSSLTNLVTYVQDPPPEGQCIKTSIYIADTSFHGLIIYDYESKKAWRAENKLMHPDPDFGTISVGGEKIDLMDGIVGLSVTPLRFQGDPLLYFNSLAGETQNSVPLSILANRTVWMKNINAFRRKFIPVGRRGIQCTVQAMDSKGNAYCVTMDSVSLLSWNIGTPYDSNYFKVLADDKDQLQFATGLKVVSNAIGQEELWVLTNRFQKVLTGSRRFDEINFRILACNINDMSDLSSTCRVVRN